MGRKSVPPGWIQSCWMGIFLVSWDKPADLASKMKVVLFHEGIKTRSGYTRNPTSSLNIALGQRQQVLQVSLLGLSNGRFSGFL